MISRMFAVEKDVVWSEGSALEDSAAFVCFMKRWKQYVARRHVKEITSTDIKDYGLTNVET